MAKNKQWQRIPTSLNERQFNQFVLPHLETGRRGPGPKLSLHVIFNYILRVLYTGCQWKELPITKDHTGQPEIQYTRVYRMFRFWEVHGCLNTVFEGVVSELHQAGLPDTAVLHGDGTTSAAKKGGDNIGFSGHKKIKGDKVVFFCDRNCNVVSPFVSAAGNRNESPMLRDALPKLTHLAKATGLSLTGSIVSLDGVYDSRASRKAIFNRGMTPNINENRRGRKSPKRGRKQLFDQAIFKERFRTIERVFAWEDKFKRVVTRYEVISRVHYAFKTLAYTLINLRHFCQT